MCWGRVVGYRCDIALSLVVGSGMDSDSAVQTIEDAAAEMETAKRAEVWRRMTRANSARWTKALNGRIYRPVMRVMHHYGWCWPQPAHPEGEVMWWCHWCGLRGRK